MKEVKNIIDSKYHFNDYELKKNFDEAYKDDTFKNIVNKIKLPKEELIKYTSLIKDCSVELKNCENCKNIMECKNTVTGYVYYPSLEQNNLVFSYIACKYKKKLEKERAYQNNVMIAMIAIISRASF